MFRLITISSVILILSLLVPWFGKRGFNVLATNHVRTSHSRSNSDGVRHPEETNDRPYSSSSNRASRDNDMKGRQPNQWWRNVLVEQQHNLFLRNSASSKKSGASKSSMQSSKKSSSMKSTNSMKSVSSSSTGNNIKSIWYAAGTKASLPPTEVTSNGNTYITSADVELTKPGIVSLAAAKRFVRSVTCYPDATVGIRMVRNVDDSMESLFPIGAILVVSSEVFGPCTLFPTEYVSPSRAAFVATADGYLRITSRSGTPQNAVVTGQAVTFLSLFDTVKVMARRIDSEGQVNDSGAKRRLDSIEKVSKEWKLDPPENDMTLEVSLEGTNRCSIDAFVLEKGDIGWEYVLDVVIDIGMKFEASITMDAGLDWKYPEECMLCKKPERKLAEIPIYAVSMAALRKLAKLVKLELPEVKAGILLEMLVDYEVEAKAEVKLGPKLTVEAATGRKAIKPYAYGSADIVIWPPGVELDFHAWLKDDVENTPATFGAKLEPAFDFSTPPTIESSIFVYFKPQIVLAAAPLISLDAPSKVGLNLGAKVGFP